MAVFYVLPPRTQAGDHFAAYLRELFPGLDWDARERLNLADGLLAAAAARPEVFVVFRDELPGGAATPSSLADAFGAEPGDEVIEVRLAGVDELAPSRWQIRRAA